MNTITKKAFIESISNYEYCFVCSAFRRDDEKMKIALNQIKPEQIEKAEKRKVIEKHSNYIVFSNGSRLYFDNEGEKVYIEYVNIYGVLFIIQKTIVYDSFDNEYQNNYIVYAM